MVLENKKKLNSNFIPRTLTTLFLFPIIIYCVYIGDYLSKSLIIIFSFFLSNEWYSLTQKKEKKKKLNRIIFVTLILFNLLFSFFLYFPFSIFLTIFISSFYTFKHRVKKYVIGNNNEWLFYGLLYICIPLLIFIQIGNLYNGKIILLWFLVIVFSTDIFSYIFGNLIKGPKIFPIISPSKTYTGTIFGIFFGTISGIIFFLKYLNITQIHNLIIFSMLISLSALFGDLLISKIKRFFKAKHSGNLLPGHGGLLDRYDSVAFGLIILLFLVYFM